MGEVKPLLIDLLKARARPEGRAWFEQALQQTEALQGADPRFFALYTAASRKLGKEALLLDEEEKGRLQSLDPALQLDPWGLDELARAILLISLSHLPRQPYLQLAQECYHFGDVREQESWLRSLSLLPSPEDFLEMAIDSCRTNILPLFESIACENPYPARYFPDLNFNQMVLKSLFNEIRLVRITGLESRFNPELSRMAADYASERQVASRSIPPDIWWVIAPHSSPEQRAWIFRYLGHEDPEHRYWAAVGLGYVADEEVRERLKQQRERESDPRVREAIESSLGKMSPSTPG